MSRSADRRLAGSLVLGCLLLVPVALPAQVGSLINKARQAATDAGNAKPLGSSPQLGDPFDAASLDAALRGLRAYHAKKNEVASLTNQYLAAQKRRSDLETASSKSIDQYRENDRKVADCYSEQINAISNARSKDPMAMASKLMDPKFAADYSRITQDIQKAAQTRDTSAMKRLNTELLKLMGADPRADTAAAATKCGPRPPKPAAIAQIEQLDKQTDDLNAKIRAAESSADIEAAKAAGVTPVRFGQMRERLEIFVNDSRKFGGKEGELLKPKKAEIEGLVKTP